MSARVFVDTNILVYARDASEGEKQRRALEWMEYLWRFKIGRTSVQVLQEFYVTVTRKLKPGLAPAAARADVQQLLAWQPTDLEPRILNGAFAAEDRYGLSFWDALIVSAAQSAGCERLLTEDLQDGQRFDDLIVISPFRHGPSSLRTRGHGNAHGHPVPPGRAGRE
jgi:predicted nucleic acid-binding protein